MKTQKKKHRKTTFKRILKFLLFLVLCFTVKYVVWKKNRRRDLSYLINKIDEHLVSRRNGRRRSTYHCQSKIVVIGSSFFVIVLASCLAVVFQGCP